MFVKDSIWIVDNLKVSVRLSVRFILSDYILINHYLFKLLQKNSDLWKEMGKNNLTHGSFSPQIIK